jgi:iron complex outermembrane receptor protein
MLLGGMAAGALVAAAPHPARAQTVEQPGAQQAPVAVQEVVVTARQRAENLKDVPADVSVLTSQTLQATGVARVDGIVNLTPGVSIVNGAAEQGDTQVNIRGINSARDADPSFAFVLDGIQISDPSTFNREYSDLHQIEVVKGPQGAIYGRNAEAGAIIVTTDKPTSHFTALIDASAATYGLYTAKALVSGPLTGNLNASLSADFRNNDGEFRNSLFSGQPNLDYFQGGNVNGRLYWTPDGQDTIDVKMRYGRLYAGSINYNSVFELPLFASALATPAFYQNPNDHPFVYQNNVPNDNRQETFETSVKLDHQMPWATLTAWGLYSHTRNDLLADGTSGSFGFFNTAPLCVSSTAALTAAGVKLPPPTYLGGTPQGSLFGAYTPTACDGYQYQLREEQDESAEVRLTSPSHQRLRWLAGAYYLHIDHPVGVSTGVDSGGAPPRELFVAQNQPYDTEQLLYDDFSGDVGALFGQAQYDILRTLEGSLALRYDYEERHDHSLVPSDALTNYIDYDGAPYIGGAPLNPALDPALNPDGVHDRSKAFAELEPKVGLRWTASPQWSVYGDWGIGFKSGGFNNQGSAATIDTFINPIRTEAGYAPVDISDQYKKETSSEYELGAKGRLLDGRLSVDASVYDDLVRNSQFFEFFVGPFGLLRVVSNIDRVHLDGAELGLGYQVTPEFTLSGSAAYTYSRIDKNTVRPDTVGNQSPYTPQYTWNLAAQYDRPIVHDFLLHARLDVRGTGPTWFSDVQKEQEPTIFYALYGPLGIGDYSQTERRAYTLVNLRLGVSKDRWALTAFADNLFDTRYLNEIIPAPEFGGVFASPAEGGRYGVEASYKF